MYITDANTGCPKKMYPIYIENISKTMLAIGTTLVAYESPILTNLFDI